MKITPTSLTISQLFSSKNEQFYIPAYQRRYSWEDKQVGDLFKDVDKLSDSDSHLLGTIVCLTEDHVAGLNTLELVDGQQRITTLSLLLSALREKYACCENNDNVAEIDGFLFSKGLDGKQQNKLLLGDLDQPDYQMLMERQDPDSMVNQQLRRAYDRLAEWLDGFDETTLNRFYFKLINNVHVIRLDVGHAKDAYKLFETINNRGLSLSPTDIIKNFLLGHASVIDDAILDKVKSHWRQLIVNCDGIDTDDFFRQYMCSILRRKITKSQLIDTFKKYYLGVVKEAQVLPDYSLYYALKPKEDAEDNVLDGEDIRQEVPESDAGEEELTEEADEKIIERNKCSIVDFAQQLMAASATYGKLLKRGFDNDKINRRLYNLQRIKSFPAYVLLLDVFLHCEDDEIKLQVLRILETFMLRRHICEYRTSELDDIFSKLTPVVSKDIGKLVHDKLAKHLPSDKEFEQKFARHDYKGNFNRAKYVLEILEYDLIQDQGEYILSSGDDLHLEHIMPQTITTKKSKREFGDWVSYLGDDAVEEHSEWVNKVGNFTLLAKKLNIQASNNPFLAKTDQYKESNIALTKDVAESYNDFRFTEIKARSEELAKKARKLWKL